MAVNLVDASATLIKATHLESDLVNVNEDLINENQHKDLIYANQHGTTMIKAPQSESHATPEKVIKDM